MMKLIHDGVTIQDTWIALYIVTIIAAIEFGIIGGLATKAGSLRKLFRIYLPANKTSHNTTDKKNHTTKLINNKTRG
jgi:hypothetical protein